MFKKLVKNKSEYSDAELIAAYQKKHNPALVGELFKRYSHLVFGLCMKYLKNPERSKDEVSNIFEKLLVDLKKHQIDNFKSWLFMVSRNHCLQIIRQEKSRSGKDQEAQDAWDYADSVDEKLEKEREEQQLHQAIQLLNEDQRMCIELFYLKNKSYREIESLTGLSNKQVKSFIQNGKRNLRIQLSKIKHESAVQ